MILVDTNVLLDVLRDDQEWEAWSTYALDETEQRDWLAINPVVYAELASQFDEIEELDAAVQSLRLTMIEIPKPALFLAGHAFRRYRRSGGAKANVLADFFIGAHAAVSRAALLTRDTARIRAHFPRRASGAAVRHMIVLNRMDCSGTAPASGFDSRR